MRFRTSIILAFALLCLYFAFWRDDAPFQGGGGSHPVDVLKGATGTGAQGHQEGPVQPPLGDAPPAPASTRSVGSVVSVSSVGYGRLSISSVGYGRLSMSTSVLVGTRTSSAVYEASTGLAGGGGSSASSSVIAVSSAVSLAGSSAAPAVPEATGISQDGGLALQAEFEKEYDALGL